MINGFATSHPGLMLGSVIPGIRQELVRVQLANYLDFSDEKLLGGRKPAVNPLVEAPNMNEQHAQGHSFMEKLKALMAGGGPQHAGFHGPQPQLRQGYEAVRENRDWRRA